MENENTLDVLLKIEAEAAALVNDAQAEADKRILENEEKNRLAYEERFKKEVEARETALKKEKDLLKEQYKQALEDYKNKISNIQANEERFTALLNEYIVG